MKRTFRPLSTTLLFLFLNIQVAHAVTYEITGADLTDWLFWNMFTGVNFPVGKPTVTFDNGQGCDRTSEGDQNYCLQVGLYGGREWLAANGFPDAGEGFPDPGPYDPVPATFPTSYSGTIITDEQGNVTGGTLVTTGSIGFHLDIALNSSMFGELTNVTWDLATGNVISGSFTCHLGDNGAFLSLEFCTGQQPGGPSDVSPIRLIEGLENLNGAPRKTVSFDPQTGELKLFHEGYCCGSRDPFAIDYSMKFTATTAIVPVPAAAFLFLNALGLLGFFRHTHRKPCERLTNQRTAE